MILCFELGCGMIFAYFELLLVGVPFVDCFWFAGFGYGLGLVMLIVLLVSCGCVWVLECCWFCLLLLLC